MAFAAESTNYLDQIRNMLQQRSNGGLGMPGLDPYGSPERDSAERTSLAKLIRSNSISNGGGAVTSVIQSAPPHQRTCSPDMKMPPALVTPPFGLAEATVEALARRNLNGFGDGHGTPGEMHRFSGSLGSNASSNISPISAGSGTNEHDDIAESPTAKVPTGVLIRSVNMSPVRENAEDDSMPPGSPKSESNDSACSERSFDQPAYNYNQLLRQQLLMRHGLPFRMGNPAQGPLSLPHADGSDAEAEHTSNSPSSSDLQDGSSPPPGQEFTCQICNFHSASKFHYNSHMNTHQVHRCPIQECNYSTRTEGRLRRHVKGHHQSSRDPSVGDDTGSFCEERSRKNSEGGSTSGGPANSSTPGKPKTYRCKTCHDFVALTKQEHFEHLRLHIKPEKQLQCPLEGCRFVTEYKHHLEYHVRNHSGSKPFKCSQPNCNYTCVNKSMLNSHMKSHSNFYQYRCECGYATKYCHSLKLHLKKYNHKATNNGPESAQLSMASSPQPVREITASPIKSDEPKPAKRRRNPNKVAIAAAQNPATGNGAGFSGYSVAMNGAPGSGMGEGTPVSMPGGFPYGLYSGVGGLNGFHAASIYNNLLLSAAAANGMMNPAMRMNGLTRGNGLGLDAHDKRDSPSPAGSDHFNGVSGSHAQDLSSRKHNGVLRMLPQSRVIRSTSDAVASAGALDLSGGKENGSERHSESPKSDGSSAHNAEEVSSSRRRRKGPAFKIDYAVRQRLQDTNEEEEQSFNNGVEMEVTEEKCPVIQPESPPDAFNHAAEFRQNGTPKEALLNGHKKKVQNGMGKKVKREFSCEYCAMGFEDSTMYTMHMGFHGRDDPFTCGLCGHSAGDKIAFFLHIAKAPHF